MTFTTTTPVSVTVPRSAAVAGRLLVVGALLYLFKFCYVLLLGSEATVHQNVEGLTWVVATPLLLGGAASAAWALARRRPTWVRALLAFVAVVAMLVLIGTAEELMVATVDAWLAPVAEFETSLVVVALAAVAAARVLRARVSR